MENSQRRTEDIGLDLYKEVTRSLHIVDSSVEKVVEQKLAIYKKCVIAVYTATT